MPAESHGAAAATQLAQIRPSASASTAFTSTLRTEVTRIFVCNTTGSSVTFDLYHDDDGTTYDQTTALFYGASLPANTTLEIISDSLGAGITLSRSGAIGVKPSTDQAVTFTIYGMTEEIV